MSSHFDSISVRVSLMRGQLPLATRTSSHELVKKDREAEIDRVAGRTSSDLSVEYFNYVMLPLLLLVGVVVVLRKVLRL